MELPIELQTLLIAVIGGAVAYLVTNGVTEVGEWFGKDFSATAKKLAALASTTAVAFSLDLINVALVSIPPEYAVLTSSVFAVIVAFLAASGIHRKAKQPAAKKPAA